MFKFFIECWRVFDAVKLAVDFGALESVLHMGG